MGETVNFFLFGKVPPPYGGVTNLTQSFVDFVRSDRPDFSLNPDCVFSAESGLLTKCVALLRTMRRLRGDPRAIMIQNLSTSRLLQKLLAVMLLRLVTRQRRVVLRVFGGGLDIQLGKYPSWIRKRIVHYLNCAFLRVYVEPPGLSDWLQIRLGITTSIWLNHRSLPKVSTSPVTQQERYVYVGYISKEKGILDLSAFAEQTNIWLDVYGRLESESLLARLSNRVSYCGELDSSAAAGIFQNYKALLYPSRYEGEGIPGVFIEAWMAGCPVITHDWRWLPSVVTDANGIVLPTFRESNAMSMRDAQSRLDQLTATQVRLSAEKYETSRVLNRIVDDLLRIANGRVDA